MSRQGGAWLVSCVLTGAGLAQDAPADSGVAANNNMISPDSGAAPASTEEDEGSLRAREVLGEAAEAIRRARAISYDARFSANFEGAYADMIRDSQPTVAGTVRLLRSDATREGEEWSGGGWVVAISGTATNSKGEVTNLHARWYPGGVEWIDDAEKKLMERPEREARGRLLMFAKNARVEDVESAQPYSKQLEGAGKVYRYDGEETIDGTLCDVVTVDYGGSGAKRRFAIARSDSLPRRVDRVTGGVNASTITLEIIRPQAFGEQSPFEPESLRPALPEGYAEDRKKPAAPAAPVGANPARPPAPGTGEKPTTGPRLDATQPPEVPAAPANRAAPPFALSPAGGGEKVSLESWRGSVVVLDFFGTWALGSREWHPRLAELHGEFSTRGVRFALVNVREREVDRAVAQRDELTPGLTLLVEGDATARDYQVSMYPTSVVISPAGEIVATIAGARTSEDAALLRGAIVSALGHGREPPKPDDAGGPAKDEPPATPTNDDGGPKLR